MITNNGRIIASGRAHLARLEIKLAMEELLARWPSFAADGERAVRIVSSNVRGVQHLPLVTSGAA